MFNLDLLSIIQVGLYIVWFYFNKDLNINIVNKWQLVYCSTYTHGVVYHISYTFQLWSDQNNFCNWAFIFSLQNRFCREGFNVYFILLPFSLYTDTFSFSGLQNHCDGCFVKPQRSFQVLWIYFNQTNPTWVVGKSPVPLNQNQQNVRHYNSSFRVVAQFVEST